MTTIARPNRSGWPLGAAVVGLMFVICPLAPRASAADEGADGQSAQSPAETDSLQWWEDQLQRSRQMADEEAAAADEKGQVTHPLRKSGLPKSGADSGSIQAAGPGGDIIKNDAGGYEVVSKELPPEPKSAVEEAKPATVEPKYPAFPSSDDINEMQVRRFTMSSFLSFLVIAAVVLMFAYVLPAVVGGRKRVASKVRIEKLGDWQETASPTPKEPDNP